MGGGAIANGEVQSSQNTNTRFVGDAVSISRVLFPLPHWTVAGMSTPPSPPTSTPLCRNTHCLPTAIISPASIHCVYCLESRPHRFVKLSVESPHPSPEGVLEPFLSGGWFWFPHPPPPPAAALTRPLATCERVHLGGDGIRSVSLREGGGRDAGAGVLNSGQGHAHPMGDGGYEVPHRSWLVKQYAHKKTPAKIIKQIPRRRFEAYYNLEDFLNMGNILIYSNITYIYSYIYWNILMMRN